MNNTRIGLLLAAALGLLSASALAQEQANENAETDAAAEGESGDAAAGEDVGQDNTEAAEAEAPAEGAKGEEPGSAAEGGADQGGLSDICKIDPAACPTVDFDKEARKPLGEQIYAVEQIYALRVRRFELNPYWTFSLNDQFISHPGPGLAINYYLTNVFAVGVNGNYYRWFNIDSQFNGDVRRATRLGVPLNEYDWGAALNFTYVPAYGKYAGFGDFIFQYDAYVVGGVGFLSTRPIPVFDPVYRNFAYKPKLAFNAGLGLRVFFYRWLAAIMEVRDYVYNEQLEALEVAPTQDERQNKSTWMGSKKLTHAVHAQLGVSIFLPTSFDYRLPK